MSVQVLRGIGVAAALFGVLIFGSIVGTIVTADVAVAQTLRIDVEGNRRVEADTIRSYFRVAPGERLDTAKIDAALKGLYATGLFQDVRITPGANRILVTVVENAVINRVQFEGNKKAKDEQLSSEVQSKPRGTFSRALVQSDVQRILEVYQRSGRYDVRVVPKIIELPNGRVDLIFEINEGDKTGVAKIVFSGNKAFSDQRLKDVIKTGETNWLSFLKSNDIYDPDRIEVDRDLLRRHYLKYGFVDVRIVAATGEYDPKAKSRSARTFLRCPPRRFVRCCGQSRAASTTPMPSKNRPSSSPSRSRSAAIPSPLRVRKATAFPTKKSST
jgi:outer membrane protein insertion porin family